MQISQQNLTARLKIYKPLSELRNQENEYNATGLGLGFRIG